MYSNSKGCKPLWFMFSEMDGNVFHAWAACFIILLVLKDLSCFGSRITLIILNIPSSYF